MDQWPHVSCFEENLYGPMALQVRQESPLRLENEKSARSFPAWSFSETPSGHGRLRIRVKDVSAENFIFLRSEGWGESFGPGCPPGYPPGRPRDIPLKNCMFRLHFRS